jgi:hypothetical protein
MFPPLFWAYTGQEGCFYDACFFSCCRVVSGNPGSKTPGRPLTAERVFRTLGNPWAGIFSLRQYPVLQNHYLLCICSSSFHRKPWKRPASVA